MKEEFTAAQERRFLAWIRKQPSVISGETQYIQACHVRRVAHGSGTGIKPRLMAVPMTMEEHFDQSTRGEIYVLKKNGFGPLGTPTLQEAKQWFEDRALEYREEFLTIEAKN